MQRALALPEAIRVNEMMTILVRSGSRGRWLSPLLPDNAEHACPTGVRHRDRSKTFQDASYPFSLQHL